MRNSVRAGFRAVLVALIVFGMAMLEMPQGAFAKAPEKSASTAAAWSIEPYQLDDGTRVERAVNGDVAVVYLDYMCGPSRAGCE